MMTRRSFFRPVALVVIAIVLLGGLFYRLQAQDAGETDTLLRANLLYENGRYEEAIQVYQQLVDSDINNSVIFYNLGNAYFKQGDVGRAILNYERAARLTPRDADIRANLELARAKTIDRYETEEEPALTRLVTVARSWFTLNETAVITLGLWMVSVGLFLVYRNSRRHRLREALQYGLIFVAFFLVGGIVSLGSRLYVEANAPAAVIVVDEVAVVSGPGEQYIAEFTLHSGAKVSFLEQRNEWIRIALPGDQFQGWVPSEAVEAVTGYDQST
jgi:hypothetical protein